MGEAVLVASRDPIIIETVGAAARQLAFSTRIPGDVAGLAEEIAQLKQIALFVMDLDGYPAVGFDICHRVRLSQNAPLVIVGSQRDKVTVIKALRAGADYYLPKPLDTDLTAAYLEAALRRRPPLAAGDNVVTVRDLSIDIDRKEVRLKDEVVPVTRAEYRLLACLARNLGKVTSCADLVMEIGGYCCPEQEAQQIVKVHVSRLRSKIDRDPTQPSYIANVRGFGYLLERRSTPSSQDAKIGEELPIGLKPNTEHEKGG